MASPIRPMRLRHASGSVGTAPEKVSVNRGIGQYIRLSNTHATQSIQLSFDGQRNYYTIAAGDPPLDAAVLFHYFYIKGSGASTTYEALIGEG